MPSRKYFVLLRTATDAKQQPPAPEEMQEIYAAFQALSEKYKANIVDMGGKLKPGGRILRASGVTDGPFAEAKEVIGGYMVLAASDIDEAIEVTRQCPGVVRPGTSVEIREIAAK